MAGAESDLGNCWGAGEDDVETGHGQQFSLGFGQPHRARRPRHFRAIAVAADPRSVWMVTGALTECGGSTPLWRRDAR